MGEWEAVKDQGSFGAAVLPTAKLLTVLREQLVSKKIDEYPVYCSVFKVLFAQCVNTINRSVVLSLSIANFCT